jgi:CBS domain-containing protein
MIAGEIMSREPIAVTPQATVADAARLMLDRHVGGLPVIDGKGRLVGMVTEGDLLRRAETGTERHRPHWLELLLGPGRLARGYADVPTRKIGDVMTHDVVSVAPEELLEGVATLMEKCRIKRLPVVARGRLVGIVGRADLVRALLHGLTQAKTAKRRGSDAEIRDAILAIVEAEPWGPRFSVDVTVEKGVAHLHGAVTDDRERTALKVAAGTVPGITEVRDHLAWVEPNSRLALGPEDERG